MDRERIVERITALINQNILLNQTYSAAADNTQDDELKVFFKNFAHQRKEFIAYLRGELQSLGSEVRLATPKEGDVTVQTDDHKYLVTCLERESGMLEEYLDTLFGTELPFTTMEMLNEHKVKIEECIYLADELEEHYM